MSEKLKINIVIAGRTYPLNVSNALEEEGMRKAASNINELISRYEQTYAVNDKQDVLAMCALRYASQLEIASLEESDQTVKALDKIKELSALVDAHLE